ncbi:MAG: hypothetical protein LBQ50_01660, partial [Planctomycetaceae bacterium]|nr:hypothetical protein [Planctomycetaceae bacterium]
MSHSTSETGHAVNVANFRKLIEAVATMSGTYNPTNPRLTLNELQMLENNAVASLAEVDNHKPDYLNAIGERTAAFEP